jgi:hypothetical protein
MPSHRSIAGTVAMSIFSGRPRKGWCQAVARPALAAKPVMRPVCCSVGSWRDRLADGPEMGAAERLNEHIDFTKRIRSGGGWRRSILPSSGAASAACFLRNTSPKSVKPACDLGSSPLHPGTRRLRCRCDGGGNPKSSRLVFSGSGSTGRFLGTKGDLRWVLKSPGNGTLPRQQIGGSK